MATYSCDDCGGPLGENAIECPNCGKLWTHNTIDNLAEDSRGREDRLNEKLDGINERLDNFHKSQLDGIYKLDKLGGIYEKLDMLVEYVGWFWWLLIGIPLLFIILYVILSIIN